VCVCVCVCARSPARVFVDYLYVRVCSLLSRLL
jgi:hypothetical protein